MTLLNRLIFAFLVAAGQILIAGNPYHAAVNHPERSEKDRERDKTDKPAEVLAFAGVQPGWVVADIFSASGYYTELLAHTVGPKGKVIAHNNKAYKNYGAKGAAARFTEGRLTNVTHLTSEADDLQLPAEGLDMAIMVMAYHDLYWVNEKEGWPKIDAKGFLKQLYAAMKPGGTMVIIDHNAKAGSGSTAAQDLHRIEKAYAKKDFTEAGFTFVKASDMLAQSGDDHTIMVFDKAIRGKTDRFVLVFQKPKK